MSDEKCPDCGADLDYDEVHIGIGVQRGNYGCPECGWSPKDDRHFWVEEDEDLPW